MSEAVKKRHKENWVRKMGKVSYILFEDVMRRRRASRRRWTRGFYIFTNCNNSRSIAGMAL
jgi:hypothetical protein